MPGQCAMMQGWNTAALEPLPRNSRCVCEGWLCVYAILGEATQSLVKEKRSQILRE